MYGMCTDGERPVHTLYLVSEIQNKVMELPTQDTLPSAETQAYIVVIRTRSNSIWYRVTALTPLEAVCRGEALARDLRGTVEDISALNECNPR